MCVCVRERERERERKEREKLQTGANLRRNDVIIMGGRSRLRKESQKEHGCQGLLSINILETTAILFFGETIK